MLLATLISVPITALVTGSVLMLVAATVILVGLELTVVWIIVQTIAVDTELARTRYVLALMASKVVIAVEIDVPITAGIAECAWREEFVVVIRFSPGSIAVNPFVKILVRAMDFV